jgi:hypothetical protein
MKSLTSVGNKNDSKNAERLRVTEQGTNKHGPTAEEIRARAFEIHIERGGIHGCDLEDWLQAERELDEKYVNRTSS